MDQEAHTEVYQPIRGTERSGTGILTKLSPEPMKMPQTASRILSVTGEIDTKKMAPAAGFEPATKWLTATYSTAELCRSVQCQLIYTAISFFQVGF